MRLDLIAAKWEKREFTEKQLEKHLAECHDLYISGDSHLINELVDLQFILNYYLQTFYEAGELEKVRVRRIAKFMEKAKLDYK